MNASQNPPVVRVQPTLELVVEQVVPGGWCLGRHEGKVVFVAGALPGERVRVRITSETPRHDHAEVVDVVEPAGGRREPPCPHAGECGGCDFQHATREAQLDMKRRIVIDAFRRVGKLDVETLLDGPKATGDEFGSRNRITLAHDPEGRPGLKRRGSHDVVAIDNCLLMPEEFGKTVLPRLRKRPGRGHTSVRFDSRGYVIGYGRDLVFRVGGSELTADARSFFQVNPAGTEELVEITNRYLGDDRRGTLLDLYAGVGLFAVACGAGFTRVVAAESDRRAVTHLERNLKAHRIPGEARHGTAEHALRDLPREGEEAVIVDPPRAGLSKLARRSIVERCPGTIVSISCDPATGARDAAALVAAGWRLAALRAVDLFPVTAHVETVALFTRESGRTPHRA